MFMRLALDFKLNTNHKHNLKTLNQFMTEIVPYFYNKVFDSNCKLSDNLNGLKFEF